METHKGISLFAFVFMLSLFSFSLASAAPPITQVQQFTEGYTIRMPTDNILLLNQGVEFEVHVYNISNGFPITSGICCYLHLYNSTGNHILEMEDCSTSHNFDYSFNVVGGNVTYELVTANYQCNSTNKGGYGEEELVVTSDGLRITSDDITFVILLFIVAYGILILGIATKNVPVTMLGGFATMAVGIFSINNGISGIRNELTYIICMLTIVIGGFWAVKAGLEQIQEGYN